MNNCISYHEKNELINEVIELSGKIEKILKKNENDSNFYIVIDESHLLYDLIKEHQKKLDILF